MNAIIKKALAAVITVSFCSFGMVKAQDDESGATFNVQGDLVSSYIWRGMYQTGASFQPAFSFGIAGFSLTAWGSTDFDGYQASEGLANKEIDLTAAYTFGNSGLTLSVADLWWAGQGANKYFNFKSHETAHHFEAGLAYTLPVEKFPLSVAWYTMFAGQDKDAEGGQNYSSYVELNYPFSVKRVDLNVTCGLVPYKAPQYYTNGFAVTNVALKGTTAIKVTDSFSLPIFAQAIWNPRLEDAHLVFGFTLKP
ncbi:hypothetical protein DWW90_07855 [Parabacteroides sp. AF17-28]|nr:hypothetical protein DWW90_07855 [Parabacteroides sp. AF17-28]